MKGGGSEMSMSTLYWHKAAVDEVASQRSAASIQPLPLPVGEKDMNGDSLHDSGAELR